MRYVECPNGDRKDFGSLNVLQNVNVRLEKMEVPQSEAAITAIKALQKRVRELEQEKQALNDEIYSLDIQVKLRDEQFANRQHDLVDATEMAKQMVSNAASTMVEIKAERAENERLKQRLALLEEKLGASNPACRTQAVQMENLRRVEKNITDFESLLAHIFSNQWQSIAASYLKPSELKNSDIDPDLLPRPVRDIVKRMLELPTKYRAQDIIGKRAIIQGLICSLETASDLAVKIHDLEKEQKVSRTPLRFGIEIHGLAIQLYALTRCINRFCFN